MQTNPDWVTLLRVPPDMLAEVANESTIRGPIADAIKSDEVAYESFAQACRFEAPYATSWIHGPGDRSPYLSLELAADSLAADRHRSLLADIVLSTSPSIPYDYRALAGDALVRLGVGEYADALRFVVESFEPLASRTIEAKVSVRTDGIDHLFDIPGTVQGRIDLLVAASRVKTLESRYMLARRILGDDDRAPTAMSAAQQLIADDVGTTLIAPADYLVPWDQELPGENGNRLTLAELMRIVLLCPEFKLPDAKVRPILVDFYRSVLRISGRSIIGLAAGVFHVEHGALATPSYFYQGRGAILGKGCVIDCVGGAILQRDTFLGGGFMPILIHTHKHIRGSGDSGASERKKILPCVFAAEVGARFPMDAIGLFETVDYLGKDAPYQGIRAIPVD
nr:hypothetical protein [Kibdelosporangium sp. MJ126-NF4]CEL17837.1 hypothetical protein [Kibdelosporangium sp. MJ126-NF4]